MSSCCKEYIHKIKDKITFRLILFTILGAIAGYAYYHFIGCSSGACPITANPYTSVAWGAIFGVLLGYK